MLFCLISCAAALAFVDQAVAQIVIFHVNTTNDTVDVNPGDGVAEDINGETSLRAAIMEMNAQIASGITGPFEIHLNLPSPAPGVQVEYTLDREADLSHPMYDPDNAAWDDLDIGPSPGSLVQVTIIGNGSVLQDPTDPANQFPFDCWETAPPNPAPRPTALIRWADDPPPPLPPIERDRIFDVRGNIELTLIDVELQRGSASSDGGAIRSNFSSLTLVDVIAANNVAGRHGGAIHHSGFFSPVLIYNSRICNCEAGYAGGAGNGGAIAVEGFLPQQPFIQIEDSVLATNTATYSPALNFGGLGGSFYLGEGTALILNSAIINSVAGAGGGAYLRSVTEIHHSRILGNFALSPVASPDAPPDIAAGGGLYVAGSAQLLETNVQANSANRGASVLPHDMGGGIMVGANGSLTAERSSILDNSAGSLTQQLGAGGGIAIWPIPVSGASAHLVNCTVSGNHAGLIGGGLFVNEWGAANLSHVTVAHNRIWSSAATGSGLTAFSGTTTLLSTIVSDNWYFTGTAFVLGGNCFGVAGFGIGSDHNIDSDGTCFAIGSFGPSSMLTPAAIDPVRSPCGNTWVHELLTASPAIDTADPACVDLAGNVLVLDQCGNPRPDAFGGLCDIGAYEQQQHTATCPPGASIEPEPCGSDVNGGCNSTPPAYTPIACGDTVCGTAWADANVRDTDWYTIDLPDATGNSSAELTVDLMADLPLVLFILNDDCTNIQLLAAAEADSGSPASLTACLPAPATYRVFVATGTLAGGGIFSGYPCGTTNDYVLSVACNDPCIANPPAVNSICAGAAPAAFGWTTFDFGGAMATDPPEPGCGFGIGSGDNDLWFEFTSPCTQGAFRQFDFILEPDPASPQLDRMIAVYDLCPQAGGVLRGCDAATGGAPASVTTALSPGQTVVVRVGAPAGSSADSSGLLVQYSIPCGGDRNDDCVVDIDDLFDCLVSWGPGPNQCDITGLFEILANWGDCP